jgi:predicted GIY-YIG superfamily endonuclease
MRWIYILNCYNDNEILKHPIDRNNIYYIGQTKRLYSRFWEHSGGRGGVNTLTFKPQELIAIYKVSEISKFINYNEKVVNINNDKNLEWTYYTGYNNPYYILNYWDGIQVEHDDHFLCENNIAECLMIHDKNNWENVRGGKYVRFDCVYKFPNNDFIRELPLCNCGLPCDIKKHKNKNSLYFRCAKNNMWDELKENFEYLDCGEDPCKFYKEYFTDIKLRIDRKKEIENRKKLNVFSEGKCLIGDDY